MLRSLLALCTVWLVALAPAQVKVGAPAPELGLEKVLVPPSGAVPTMASLKGKAVLLEFWGTWCGHCIEALPHLEQLHRKFSGRGVEFLSVTDEREKLVADFLKDTKMAGTVALDTDGSLFKAYQANALPTTVLIDRQGNVAGIAHPNSVSDETLEDLLAGRPLRLGETKGEKSKMPPLPSVVELAIRPSRGTSRSAGVAPHELNGFGVTALDAIVFGFRTTEAQVVLEAELPKEYYDIVARGPEGSEVAYAMLEAGLRTTFDVDIVRETRDLEVYVVRPLAGQTPKLEKAEGRESGGVSGNQAGGTSMDLRMLFSFLNVRGKRPILDETGLKDRYNWSIKTPATDFEGLRTAVREQLGLDLVREKRPMPVVVVRKRG
jgi:uncharacterized protein (TIGR03435 family)